MDKDLVFIVSAGRTGTQFFGRQLSSIVEDCVSAHEPDRYAGFSRATWESIRKFGFNQVVLQRILRRSGIRHLTQQRLAGQLSEQQVIRSIHQQRDKYFHKQHASLIVESYYQWYGLLPCLRQAYPECKIAAIVRDPRTWVMSLQHRNLRHAMGRFAGRLTPEIAHDKEHRGQWRDMNEFERICWEWKTINETILASVENDPQARLYRFEDLFLAGEDDAEMRRLLTFITNFGDRSYPVHFDDSMLASRFNVSSEISMKWPDWPGTRARALQAICGNLMLELGYGNEPAWSERLDTE